MPNDPELQASLFDKAFELAEEMLELLRTLDRFSSRLLSKH